METPWFVRDTDLLRRLTPEDMDLLQRICPYRTYRAGDVLFRRGEPATSMYAIMEGHLKLLVTGRDLHPHVLAVLGPHDLLGESFLSPGAHYRADAVVTSERATACPISRDDYLQLAFRAPRVVLTFTEVLASHLAACHDRLDITAYPLAVRVAHALLEEARRFGHADAGGWTRLMREVTHDELAGRVAATRVSVTQVISAFRQAGLLTGTRGRYQVRADGLARVIDEHRG